MCVNVDLLRRRSLERLLEFFERLLEAMIEKNLEDVLEEQKTQENVIKR